MKICLSALCCLLAVARAGAAEDVIITEFMASNEMGLLDEDGSREDWIEVFNAGTNTVNLFNWSLTDSSGNLNKWRFPATNIGPGQYMVVFASNKNRRTAGAPLHTNFKLDPSPGEYLALARADGSIATSFSPAFPAQAQDVSYGFAVAGTTNVLLSSHAPARFLVPTNFDHAPFWTEPGHDDSAWSNATTGIGFGFPTNVLRTDISAAMSNVNPTVYLRVPFTVTDPGLLQNLFLRARHDDGFIAYLNGHEVARRNAPSYATNSVLANSTNDWTAGPGAQGYNNWSYGYYNKTIDTNDNTYSHLTDFDSSDEQWTFTGAWTLGPADPPWTQISQTSWHPNGNNNSAEHWAIRRWVCPVSGVVTARVTFAKASSGGNGATLRVLVNGTAVLNNTIAGTDTTGFTTNLVLRGLEGGEVIDFALDALGTDAAATDSSDTCVFGAILTQAASGDPAWNSAATGDATPAQSGAGETIDITFHKSFLQAGTNVLAVQGMNASGADSDFLLLPELLGATASVSTNQRVYFTGPTPGAVNGNGTTNLGPLLLDVTHTPREPASNEVVLVTARAVQTFNAVGNLTLAYRVMYLGETNLAMNDAGANGDLVAGDGVFTTQIPGNIAQPGQMVRYGITARDVLNLTNRNPAYLAVRSPQYFGYVINDPGATSNLPVMQWYINGANFAAAATDTGTRCSIYFRGQFIDNIGTTLHGQSSAGFPKKSHNFNLNPGYRLTYDPEQPDIDDFALITTWADRSYLRYLAVADTYAMAGATGHFTDAVRLQTNGVFFSVAHLTEQGNEEFLQRINYDEDGALYKIYSTLTTATGNEKKTRTWEPQYDLQALVAAANNPDVNSRVLFAYDNYNFPSMVTFLAAKGINSDHDCCHKNFYLYRDSNRSAEWFAFPWDIDLSMGHVWTSTNGNYFDDTIYTNVPPYIGQNNAVFGVLYNDATLRTMWARRVRTLMDELLQAPGTATNDSILHNLINAYAAQVGPDAALDFTKWSGQARTWTPVSPVWGGPANPSSIFTNEVSRIRDYWLPGHRSFLYHPSVMTSYGLPAAQPSNVVITINSSVEYSPANGNQAQEYVQLQNTNPYAVDISGWKLEGGVQFTFQPGTVIPTNTSLYVSPDLRAFRARATGPRGGQRIFVVGPYSGRLSARGETLQIINRAGQTNLSLAYPGTPSLPQQFLRITELMYHPPLPSGGAHDQEDYEYIELRNTSTSLTLNLNGVKLTNGVIFNFTGSAITSLAPGARCLVVRSNAAFASRYGGGLPVAGAYSGSLDNGGERLQLLDAANEEILDFSYNNSWYPITDGLGFSLVVVNESASPDAWNSKSNWRASAIDTGSPGSSDPAPVTVAPVLVNEVLANTRFPGLDAIELWNPGTNSADVSGWYISDDLYAPKKFRIPTNTVIAAGGHVVFDETQLNNPVSNAASFAFAADGDDVFLFAADSAGNLIGYYHGFHFGASVPGVSFERYLDSQSNEQFVPQREATFGAANAGPLAGPVVVSEIMYHPPEFNGLDDSTMEYIELQNTGTHDVAFLDPAAPTNSFRLQDAVQFTFPTNVTLSPGGHLLVVSFNPQTSPATLAVFRAKWSVPTNTPVLGPWTGQLDNSRDQVELALLSEMTSNSWAYARVDKVDYADATPWDAGADGIAAALHRIVPGDYGNDPTNWVAAMPTPGASFGGGLAPVITLHPSNALAIAGSTVSLTVGADNPPFRFQWRFNGANLANATNATLLLTNIQYAQAGGYYATVLNGAGVVFSTTGRVQVIAPVTITNQPPDQKVLPGTNVTLVVGAVGNGPLRYQWSFNGAGITGATNASHSFTNAQIDLHHGSFTVTITDDYSSTTSRIASLFVLVRPGVVVFPSPATIVQGQSVTLTCVATGAAPIHYRWLRNNTTYVAQTASTFLTLSNLQTNTLFRVAITNLAGSTSTTNITVTVLRDSDGDGVPDNWEIAHGMITNSAADGLLDSDGDGMLNRDEYFAGTRPNDSNSVLRVSMLFTNGAPLQFTAQSNILYTIQYRTNLDGSVWQTLSNVPPAPGERAILFDSPPGTTNGPRYLRVLVPRLP